MNARDQDHISRLNGEREHKKEIDQARFQNHKVFDQSLLHIWNKLISLLN